MATLVAHNSFPFADGNTGHTVDMGSAPTAGDWDIVVVGSVTSISGVSALGTAIDTYLNNAAVNVYARQATGSEAQTFVVTTGGNFNTVVLWQRWRGLGNAVDTHVLAHLETGGLSASPAANTGTLASSTDVVVTAAVAASTQTANQSGSWSAGFNTPLDETHLGTSSLGLYGASSYKTGAGTAAESPSLSWTGDTAHDAYTAAVSFTVSAGGTAFPRTASDSVSISDSPTRAVVLPRTVVDSVPVSDAPARTAAHSRAVADTVSISDAVVRGSVHPRAVTDAVPVSDSTTVGPSASRSASDSVPISDAVTRAGGTRPRAVADSLSISDSTNTSPADRVTFVVARPIPSLWAIRYMGVPMNRSVLSLDWVRYAILASSDPTTDVVQFAFVAAGASPAPSDWVAGSWEPSVLSTGEYVARVLVGPGGTIALARGVWSVWVKITDNPTHPVWNVGTLSVT